MEFNDKIIHRILSKHVCELMQIDNICDVKIVSFYKKSNDIDICYIITSGQNPLNMIRGMCNDINKNLIYNIKDGYHSFVEYETEYYLVDDNRKFNIHYRYEINKVQYFLYHWFDYSGHIYFQVHEQTTKSFNKAYRRDFTKDNFNLIDELQ